MSKALLLDLFAMGNTISCCKECHIKRPYRAKHISLLSNYTKVQGNFQTPQCVPLGIFCKCDSITQKQLLKFRGLLKECLGKVADIIFSDRDMFIHNINTF